MGRGTTKGPFQTDLERRARVGNMLDSGGGGRGVRRLLLCEPRQNKLGAKLAFEGKNNKQAQDKR